MQFNIRQAKSQLPKLIKAALAGEEVIIANGKRPVVKLVPALPSTEYRLGGLAGIIPPPADSFFDPMTEDELREWE